MNSHSKIYLKGKILIIVSEMTQIISQAIKVHNFNNIQSVILANAINVFGPISRLTKKENDGFLVRISNQNLNLMTIETKNNGQIRASFYADKLKFSTRYFQKFSLDKLIDEYIGNSGLLRIKNLNQKNNYEGQILLEKGGFSSNLINFFEKSQQTKLLIKNLIKFDKNLEITKAQSVIIQFLPGFINNEINEVNSWFQNQNIPDFMSFFANFPHIETQNWIYFCTCGEKNFDSTLSLLTENEIDNLIKKFGKIEFKCNFCAKSQIFNKKDWIFAQKPFSLATVESITGGAFAAKIVEKNGASSFFSGGLICYQNQIKNQIGIETKNGVVNAKTALKMVDFGKNFFGAKYVISFTGNAGPALQDGKLGQVFIALNEKVWELNFSGSRTDIIQACVDFATKKINDIRPGTILE